MVLIVEKAAEPEEKQTSGVFGHPLRSCSVTGLDQRPCKALLETPFSRCIGFIFISNALEGPEGEAAFGFAFELAVTDGEDFDFDAGEALVFEAEFAGGAGGEVDDATGDEGSAVVEADFEGAAIFEVGDFDAAGEGEGFVGAGDVPGLDFFAEGGVAAFESEEGGFVVPGGDAAFFVAKGLVDGHGVIADALDGVGAGHVAGVATGTAGDEEEGEDEEETFVHEKSLP